jgi:16S rRNA (guanine527-N7)-methyltransferase
MTDLSNSRLSEILLPFGVGTDVALSSSVRAYIDLLLLWNKKISLTSIEGQEEIAKIHFGESFFASSVISMSQGRLADVGSGAGFPGVPIKMLAPELHLSLVESNAKKAAFLCEVVRKLDLKQTEVLNARMETLPPDTSAFDFISARAVGDHEGLLKWAGRHLAPSGKLILFLGADAAEIISHEAAWSWSLKKIPDTRQRVLLVGTPN